MPFAGAKQELAGLAKPVPETQDKAAMLTANLQLARARAALGDKKAASQLLTEVISQSQRMGHKLILLEAKLTLAEIEMQSGRSPSSLAEIEQIAHQADALGLKWIATKARASLKKPAPEATIQKRTSRTLASRGAANMQPGQPLPNSCRYTAARSSAWACAIHQRLLQRGAQVYFAALLAQVPITESRCSVSRLTRRS